VSVQSLDPRSKKTSGCALTLETRYIPGAEERYRTSAVFGEPRAH
jgi:hypothetical protein